MTFVRLRRDIINERTANAGDDPVTFRLSTMVEQLENLHSGKGDVVMLRERLIPANAAELDDLHKRKKAARPEPGE